MKVDEYGVITHAPPDSDPDENDGLPWEVGLMRCALCGHQTPVVTHWPTVRNDLECSECGQFAMMEIEEL